MKDDMQMIESMGDNALPLVYTLREISDKLLSLSSSIVVNPIHIDTELGVESHSEYIRLMLKVQTTLEELTSMADDHKIHPDHKYWSYRFCTYVMNDFWKPPLDRTKFLDTYATDSFLSTRLTRLLTHEATVSYVATLRMPELFTYIKFAEAVHDYVVYVDTNQTMYYLKHGDLTGTSLGW
jgi:hypothetical protein